MADVLADHDGLVAFGEGLMNHSTWQYGFWTRTAFLPVRDLVGCMVNLGDKGGAVYEGVTVAAIEGGCLVLENGRMGWPWQPGRPVEPVTRLLLPITEVARGFTRPTVDVEAIRALLMAKVDRHHRYSAVHHHVAGTGAEYGQIVSLTNHLKDHPADAHDTAARWARDGRTEGSTAGCVQRADLVDAMLAVYEGIDHEGPAHVIQALEVYARMLRGGNAYADGEIVEYTSFGPHGYSIGQVVRYAGDTEQDDLADLLVYIRTKSGGAPFPVRETQLRHRTPR
jgi:hypothetical protein